MAQIEGLIEELPADSVQVGTLVDRLGAEGLLLTTILLTLVFLIPVSIPGVSTAFGAAILLVGISRLRGRALWLPQRLRERAVSAPALRSALLRGLKWLRRLEKVSRPHRLAWLVDLGVAARINNLAFVFAALLLMAPFGFVPFSNTLPAVALLFYAIGMMQRDGGAILLGHVANIGTVIYFGALLLTGGVVVRQAIERLFGA